MLAEFGDDPDRYASAKARKNYAGTSPITRASGKKKVALARFVHNDRLIDALMTQAFNALLRSPGARAYYDRQRARGSSHNAALRQLANRLVGILHGCLKTGTLYDETTAWPSWDVFQAWMIASRSAATAVNKHKALQQFFTWLADENEIQRSPMERTRLPKNTHEVDPDHRRG
ncbi:hypothetical protein BJ970_004425 [Saccharopolyspora phatthalungensis]|uniref:Transposase IS116/IS110/IS902 C-terminal domain-containing protein n=1 Tax=Saccharopolyspora phatthalungensis TaxID=664693 RepID=A0A840QAU1_9PSEU|nr:hypothetical protein [Saccharopolyspora phatthalungensis]